MLLRLYQCDCCEALEPPDSLLKLYCSHATQLLTHGMNALHNLTHTDTTLTFQIQTLLVRHYINSCLVELIDTMYQLMKSCNDM